MTNYSIGQISKLDSPALTAVIDYWKDHSTETVLLAYGELKKRNFAIPDRLQKRQDEFCKQNGKQNMDDYLSEFLGQNPTHKDYFDRKATEPKPVSQTTSETNPSKEASAGKYRYPALRTIAGIYMVLAYIVGLVTLGVSFYLFTEQGAVQGLVCLVLGTPIALGVAATSEGIKVFLDIEYNTRKASMKE